MSKPRGELNRYRVVGYGYWLARVCAMHRADTRLEVCSPLPKPETSAGAMLFELSEWPFRAFAWGRTDVRASLPGPRRLAERSWKCGPHEESIPAARGAPPVSRQRAGANVSMRTPERAATGMTPTRQTGQRRGSGSLGMAGSTAGA